MQDEVTESTQELRDRVAALQAEIAGVREGMAHRAPIEQAKGVVVAATGASEDEAFATLVRISQRQNRKLRLIAEEIIERVRTDGIGHLSAWLRAHADFVRTKREHGHP